MAQVAHQQMAQPATLGHIASEGETMPPRTYPADLPPENLTLADVWSKLQRIEWLVDGNSDYDIKGLRGELEDTQSTLATLVSQRDKMTWVIRGLIVGLGITTLGTIAQFLPGLLTALSSIK